METDSTLNIGMWLPQPAGDAVPTDCAACGVAIGNCPPEREWLCDKCYVEETSRISTARIAELERLLLAAQNRIGDLCMLVGNIEQCRAVEGDSVTILCDNPEADSIETQAAVEVFGDYTGHELQRFYGKTWAEAIAKAARVAQLRQPDHDSEWLDQPATADVIGGFPVVQSICMGCGKTLLLENAWMTDGCPCNSVLGVNSMNETRWRLLMQLQQSQAKSSYLLFIPRSTGRVAMLDGRIRVLVDDKQVTLPGRIEG